MEIQLNLFPSDVKMHYSELIITSAKGSISHCSAFLLLRDKTLMPITLRPIKSPVIFVETPRTHRNVHG